MIQQRSSLILKKRTRLSIRMKGKKRKKRRKERTRIRNHKINKINQKLSK
jgi:hypothetical protein